MYKRYLNIIIGIILLWVPLYYLSQAIYYNPSLSENVGYYFTFNPMVLNLKYHLNNNLYNNSNKYFQYIQYHQYKYNNGDLVLLCLNDSHSNGLRNNYSNIHNHDIKMQGDNLNVLYELGLPHNHNYNYKYNQNYNHSHNPSYNHNYSSNINDNNNINDSNISHNNININQNNICGNSSAYLLKQIVAIEGDEVNVTPNGVYINNKLYPNSKIQQNTIHNGVQINLFPMPYGNFRLGSNEYFVLGKTIHSYDSRYFGVINAKQIYRKALYLGNLGR